LSTNHTNGFAIETPRSGGSAYSTAENAKIAERPHECTAIAIMLSSAFLAFSAV